MEIIVKMFFKRMKIAFQAFFSEDLAESHINSLQEQIVYINIEIGKLQEAYQKLLDRYESNS